MKESSETFAVVATREPTFTAADRAKSMPELLTRNTRPLALRIPSMTERWPPVTRLSVLAVEEG